jgi:hypothetical protein
MSYWASTGGGEKLRLRLGDVVGVYFNVKADGRFGELNFIVDNHVLRSKFILSFRRFR